MKAQYVRELAVGSRVNSSFSLVSKEMRSTRNGEAFLVLEFADKTGRIPAVFFRPDSGSLAVPTDTVVRVEGTVTRYKGVKRVSVDLLTPSSEYRIEDYLAASDRDIDEVKQGFRRLASSVKERSLSKLLRVVFSDKDLYARFCSLPGAQTHHHAHTQGLIEHTVAVASLCRYSSTIYPQVDGDLLVTAALLHDIGKVDELDVGVGIGYTDEGRLTGHVVLGHQRVVEACSRVPGMDGAVRARLCHAILSHHGELEWGSPKRPATLEALLLHHADNMDAKAAGFSSIVSGAGAMQEAWTDTDNLFRRPLYAPMAAEEQRNRYPAEDEQYARATA